MDLFHSCTAPCAHPCVCVCADAVSGEGAKNRPQSGPVAPAPQSILYLIISINKNIYINNFNTTPELGAYNTLNNFQQHPR